jgi:hypothetical protein
MEMDFRHIFTILIYTSGEASSTGRLIRITTPLDVKWVIDQEWAAEAGNMALSSECVDMSNGSDS